MSGQHDMRDAFVFHFYRPGSQGCIRPCRRHLLDGIMQKKHERMRTRGRCLAARDKVSCALLQPDCSWPDSPWRGKAFQQRGDRPTLTVVLIHFRLVSPPNARMAEQSLARPSLAKAEQNLKTKRVRGRSRQGKTNLPIIGKPGRTASPHSWVKYRMFVLMQLALGGGGGGGGSGSGSGFAADFAADALLMRCWFCCRFCCRFRCRFRCWCAAASPVQSSRNAETYRLRPAKSHALPSHSASCTPRPVKFFLDQLDERSLLPANITLAER